MDQKTNNLLSIIDALCKPNYSKEDNIKNDVILLKEIYCDGYRHSYSDIFNKLQCIFNEDIETGICLRENLIYLGDYLKETFGNQTDNKAIIDVLDGFKKLSDHINLEIGRYNFIKDKLCNKNDSIDCEEINNLKEMINNTDIALDRIKPLVIEAKKVTDNIDEKLENNKLSSITALTIFSAVILAFSGGITFEAGVLKGMANISPYRLVFIVTLTGFILFNTIFALLYIIAKMTGKNIGSRCKYLSSNKSEIEKYDLNRLCGDDICTKKCSSVTTSCKVWHKYSYILAINVIFLFILYETFILWLFKSGFQDFEFFSKLSFYFSIPLILFSIFLILVLIFKYNQRKKIKLDLKVRLLTKYLYPDIMQSITQSISDNFLILNNKTSFRTRLNKMIYEIGDTDKKSFQKLLKDIDKYISSEILSENELMKTISWSKNKQNKFKWNELKKELQKQINNKKVFIQ